MLVDHQDMALVASLSWSWSNNKNTQYASCRTSPWRGQLAHRMILGAPEGVQVDHRNGNGLDNRRANLREATHSQNCCNTRPRKDRSSKYRGIRLAPSGAFVAKISINGKRLHLGTFKTDKEAALAFDKAAKEHRGEFAILNFPETLTAQGDQADLD